MLIHLSLEDMPGRWVTHAICSCQASNLPDLHLVTGISGHTSTCPLKVIYSFALSLSALVSYIIHVRKHAHIHAISVFSFANSLNKAWLYASVCFG